MDRRAKITEEDLAALNRARKLGRDWKTQLRLSWETGIYSACISPDDRARLQCLRNSPDFGPRGLSKFSPSRLGLERSAT